jgi:hypothetical protein
MTPSAWTALATICLAAATFLTALVAFFQDGIQRWLRRSRLSLEIRKVPPDTHQIAMSRSVTGPGGIRLELPQVPALWVRARVTHLRGPSATEVEMVVEKVWNGHGQERVQRETFLPLNLSWAHVGGSTMKIPRGLFRHCDIGRFEQDAQSTSTVFVFSTIVQPNVVATGSFPNVLKAGDYEFDLLMTGENVKPVRTTWRLSFPPAWSDDQDEMLNRIAISRVDPD